MHKLLPVLAITLLLSGCSLPLSVQLASWALDGISYVATGKSVTDHGISMVVDQDCALLRGITEGSICRENISNPVLVATTIQPDFTESRQAIAPPYLEVM